MITSTCSFSFNLSAWNIVTNKVLSAEDWRQGEAFWAENAADRADFSPKLAFLPPMKRRRLSDSARLFFEAAWELLPENANIPVVYASNNSEINRSFALWQSLLKEGDVSPTSFSLSVHNALVGQWSEFRQVTAETVAISANRDNLETALLEAYLLLNDGNEKVLVVVAESPLLETYNAQPVVRQPLAYALALVVEKGEQYGLTLWSELPENGENSTALSAQNMPQDNALAWVRQQFLSQNQWVTANSTKGFWQWQKN